jgi:hypothetical protein
MFVKKKNHTFACLCVPHLFGLGLDIDTSASGHQTLLPARTR